MSLIEVESIVTGGLTIEVLNDDTVELLEVEGPTAVEVLFSSVTVETDVHEPGPRITASPNPPPDPLIGDVWIDMSS